MHLKFVSGRHVQVANVQGLPLQLALKTADCLLTAQPLPQSVAQQAFVTSCATLLAYTQCFAAKSECQPIYITGAPK